MHTFSGGPNGFVKGRITQIGLDRPELMILVIIATIVGYLATRKRTAGTRR